MNQPSILSFFGSKSGKKDVTDAKNDVDNNASKKTKDKAALNVLSNPPVKTVQIEKKRKRLIEESSSDEEKSQLIRKRSRLEKSEKMVNKIEELQIIEEKKTIAEKSTTLHKKEKTAKLDEPNEGSASSEEEVKPKMPSKAKKTEKDVKKKSVTVAPVKPKKEPVKSEAMQKTVDDAKMKPADYSVLKKSYHTINDACWSESEKVPYLALARTFADIESVSSRLAKIEAYSNFLRSVIELSPDDLLASLYLCLNRVAPNYTGIELNIGESFVVKALSRATGTGIDRIKNRNKSVGDLGQIAFDIKGGQTFLLQPKILTVDRVFSAFKDLAAISGKSAQDVKVNKVRDLLLACRRAEERKYLVRGLLGKLSIQFGEQSVLASLGTAVALSPLLAGQNRVEPAEACMIVKRAVVQCPDYGAVVAALTTLPLSQLHEVCSVRPGMPVKPMLAQPSRGVAHALARLEPGALFTCEYKYDGERAQIHLWRNDAGDVEVRVFSRNQEDNTKKYPDIVRMVSDLFKDSDVVTCIIDSEAVAWDRETGSIRPFQELSTRKRKDVREEDIKIQVCVYAFDMLYFNGRSLVRECLRERRRLLREHCPTLESRLVFANSIDIDDVETIDEFMEQSIKDKCEGLMVKTLDKNANYEISTRSRRWLKLKKDYLDGLGDSMDLVVIGAYHGNGKRANKYGAFLMACYDPETDKFQAICKLGTGFKDTDLDETFAELSPIAVSKADLRYQQDTGGSSPGVWFPPRIVWEVKAADMSLSPKYTAAIGLVDRDKGISLRFPRYLRTREDKKPENATNARQISDMYRSQANIQGSVTHVNEEDDEFY